MRRTGSVVALLALVVAACSSAATPTARPDRPQVRSPVASTSTAPGAAQPPTPPVTVPELTFEPFRVEGKPLNRVFAIEGATAVATDNVVGYIDGERVEWIAKVPKERPPIGKNIITYVGGKYLDAIDVIMETDNGRASMPVWLPLTGKGSRHTEAGGGGSGDIHEAWIGDSVVLWSHSSLDNTRMTHVRGPKITRKYVNAKICKKGFYAEPYVQHYVDQLAAVRLTTMHATANGALVGLGDHCLDDGKPYAEVWPPGSMTSKLIDLRPYLEDIGYHAELLRSGPDGLWVYSSDFEPLLRFEGESFKLGPQLGRPISDVFLSATGELHVRSTDEIYRLDAGDKWTLVARLTNLPERVWDFVMDAQGRFWASSSGEVYRLRETRQVAAASTCPGWFTYLSGDHHTDAKKQLPALRKILADYPANDGLTMVEVTEWHSRHPLGVSFATKDQAEAFAAHVKTADPTSRASVFCYKPSKTESR